MKRMNKNHPTAATLKAPGQSQGTTILVPTDTPMGRQMRRYLERVDKRLRGKISGGGRG